MKNNILLFYSIIFLLLPNICNGHATFWYPDNVKIVAPKETIQNHEEMLINIFTTYPDNIYLVKDDVKINEHAELHQFHKLGHNKYQITIISTATGNPKITIPDKVIPGVPASVIYNGPASTSIYPGNSLELKLDNNWRGQRSSGYLYIKYHNKPIYYSYNQQEFEMSIEFNKPMSEISDFCKSRAYDFINATCVSGRLHGTTLEVIVRVTSETKERVVLKFLSAYMVAQGQRGELLSFNPYIFIPFKEDEDYEPTIAINTASENGLPITVESNLARLINGDKSPTIEKGTDFGVIPIGQTSHQLFTIYSIYQDVVYLGDEAADDTSYKLAKLYCCKAKTTNSNTEEDGSLDNTHAVDITGDDADQFEFIPWTHLPGGLSNLRQKNAYPFQINFKPTKEGKSTASIVIRVTQKLPNTETITRTFKFDITGIGVDEEKTSFKHLHLVLRDLEDQFNAFGIQGPIIRNLPQYYKADSVIKPIVCKAQDKGPLPAEETLEKSIYGISGAVITHLYKTSDHCFTFQLAHSHFSEESKIKFGIKFSLLYSQEEINALKKITKYNIPRMFFVLEKYVEETSELEGTHGTTNRKKRSLRHVKNHVFKERFNNLGANEMMNHASNRLKNNHLKDGISFNLNGGYNLKEGSIYFDRNSLYTEYNKLNIWNMIEWKSTNNDDNKNQAYLLKTGVDYKLSDNMLLGMFWNIDKYNGISDIEIFDSLKIVYNGWLFGTYFIFEAQKDTFINLYIGSGKSNNILNYEDSNSDEYVTDQYLAGLSLKKDIKLNKEQAISSPYVNLDYYKEKQYGFVSYDGEIIDETYNILGSMSIGIRNIFRLPTPNDSKSTLSIDFSSSGEFENTTLDNDDLSVMDNLIHRIGIDFDFIDTDDDETKISLVTNKSSLDNGSELSIYRKVYIDRFGFTKKSYFSSKLSVGNYNSFKLNLNVPF